MIFVILKKIILLCMILYAPKSFSESISLNNIHFQPQTEIKNSFRNSDDKLGYDLGVSLGNYVNQSFEKQKKIGINLDKNSLLKGVQDAISGNLQLSHQEISSILMQLEEKLKNATKIQLEKNAK